MAAPDSRPVPHRLLPPFFHFPPAGLPAVPRVVAAASSAGRCRRAVLCLMLLCVVATGLFPVAAHAEGARWQWPLPPPHEVVAPFEAPEHRYGPGHRGIDIAVSGDGAEVRAVEPGTVRFSGMVAGRGVVSVTHADGLISTYEPVTGLVTPGEPVQVGDVLGTIESVAEASHCPGQSCLHLGARRGEDYLDPLLLLGARGPSVLLPWGGGPHGGAAPQGVRGPQGGAGSDRAAVAAVSGPYSAAVDAPARVGVGVSDRPGHRLATSA